MKFLTGGLAALALALIMLTGPSTKAHDLGTLHFHGEQLSMDSGTMCYRSCLRKLGDNATDRCARECANAASGNQNSGQNSGPSSNQGAAPTPQQCQTMANQCRQQCAGNRSCIQQCNKTGHECSSAGQRSTNCQSMLMQCSRECGADRGCIQRCRRNDANCRSN